MAVVHKPHIETCRLGVESHGGEVFNSTFVGNTTSCENTRDTFANVQPKEFHFEFTFVFKLPEDPPAKHSYVAGYSYGIVGGRVELRHYPNNGGTISQKAEITILQLYVFDYLFA